MQNFRTYQLAKQLFQDSKKVTFKGEMKDQFTRALLSVVLNLAEGAAKPTIKDRRRFFSIAMGSLRESQAILELNNESELLVKLDRVAGSLWRLIQNPGPGPAA